MAFNFILNGNDTTVEAEPSMPLLWVLRDILNLTGTKFGCGVASCGACTIHLDGKAARSCVLPVEAVAGRSIQTIEGVSEQGLNGVQQAWIEYQVPQCGYCQSGVIMAVISLLQENSSPTEKDIHRTITNICRCGSYPAMRRALASLLP